MNNRTNSEDLPSTAEALSVREAAYRLGVSERTVYRMLRAGKLQRVGSSDRFQTYVSVQNADIEMPSPSHSSDKSDNRTHMSDTLSSELLERIEALKQEIVEKDSQIQKLLENQERMQAMVEKVQEQMYELARLVLTQNAAQPSSAVAQGTAKDTTTKQSSHPLVRLFRRSNDNS